MPRRCFPAILAAGLMVSVPLASVASIAPKSTAGLAHFVGGWTCHGQSASGKVIGGHTTFEWALGRKWIVMRHQDNPPSTYEVASWWGFDALGKQMTGTIFDNMGTLRHYVLSDAAGHRLTLENTATTGYIDRFVFQSHGKNSYQVTYYRKAGDRWKKVDSSTCRRDGIQ